MKLLQSIFLSGLLFLFSCSLYAGNIFKDLLAIAKKECPQVPLDFPYLARNEAASRFKSFYENTLTVEEIKDFPERIQGCFQREEGTDKYFMRKDASQAASLMWFLERQVLDELETKHYASFDAKLATIVQIYRHNLHNIATPKNIKKEREMVLFAYHGTANPRGIKKSGCLK